MIKKRNIFFLICTSFILKASVYSSIDESGTSFSSDLLLVSEAMSNCLNKNDEILQRRKLPLQEQKSKSLIVSIQRSARIPDKSNNIIEVERGIVIPAPVINHNQNLHTQVIKKQEEIDSLSSARNKNIPASLEKKEIHIPRFMNQTESSKARCQAMQEEQKHNYIKKERYAFLTNLIDQRNKSFVGGINGSIRQDLK